MKKMKKGILAVLLSLGSFAMIANLLAVPQNLRCEGARETNFISTQGTKFVDSYGEVYQIKGMGFTNKVWDFPEMPVESHHDEQSYRELAELGLNTVRFCLNYNLLEDDENPYTYKQSGFDWIDENIKWAKQNGIRLILSMNYVQGGKMTYENGMKFWLEEENQKRLVLLWREIATRYAQEENVLGYDLLNEPNLPKCSSLEESIAYWNRLANTLTEQIRMVDENHILFLQSAYGCIDLETGEKTYPFGDFDSFPKIKDKNYVYEIHFYHPTQFVSQGLSWVEKTEWEMYYPSLQVYALGNEQRITEIAEKTYADTKNQEWQQIKTTVYPVTDTRINAGIVKLYMTELGAQGSCYVDDVTVKEYDAQGRETGVVYHESFSSKKLYTLWWVGKKLGSMAYDAREGNQKAGCLRVTGTEGKSIINEKMNSVLKYFPIKQGYSYQICAWVKPENCNNDAQISATIEFYQYDNLYSYDKGYLERMLYKYITFAKEKNVPLYVGEFGTSAFTILQGMGGSEWVTDMITLMNQYGVGYSYHAYHCAGFGLYLEEPDEPRKTKNEELARILKENVSPQEKETEQKKE